MQANGNHYAVFWGPGFPGSVHDFWHHEIRAPVYTDYLRMREGEEDLYPDHTTGYFSIALDSGYIGQVVVPYERRVIPKPSTLHTHRHKEQTAELKRKRVVVEQFFGRMKTCILFTSRPYPFDRNTYFDTDIDSCIMLTNEHIKLRALSEHDSVLYLKYWADIRLREEERAEKHRKSTRKWRAQHQQLVEFGGVPAAGAAGSPARPT